MLLYYYPIITRRYAVMSKTQSSSLVDSMTGLKNYECFTKEFEELALASVEKCEDLSLAMVDIDQFMRINDEYGHDAGDQVILSISRHLTANVPENARVYRYAGDQFAALLPATEKEKALLIMEKMREKFCTENIVNTENGGHSPKVTLSIGISCCPDDGSRGAEIIRKAEGALYRAKVGGRNKVCLSREEKMVTKTSHYTYEQLQRLSELAKKEGMGEAILLREALDDLLKKYDY
jgi:diguanylate cyclase (GGDEF)-like protein